jgi:putative ABC transport system permease protein
MSGLAALSMREAWRGFVRQRFTFVVAFLTLVLGLSLATAMLCVLYGVILRPLPYGDPSRVVMAWAGYEGGSSERESFSEDALVAWGRATGAFDGLAGFQYTMFTLLQRGEPVSLQGAIVSPEIFPVLSARARIGNVFSPESARASQGKVALLSYRLWQQRFGSDPSVIGSPVNLGDEAYTISGVMPDDFDVPSRDTAVWVPLMTGQGRNQGRSLMVVGRLKNGVSLPQANADATRIAGQLAGELPEGHRGMRIHLVRFFDELVRDSAPLVIVATVAVLLVLAICCANISNLLLVRAIVRRAEFATRVAIGAQRRHLLGVVFAESLLLALCGGLVSALVARGLIAGLVRLSPVELPRAAAIGHGWQVPLVAGALVLFVALLVSIPAAWEVLRARVHLASGAATRTTSRGFARRAIVALEMALALALLTGSGLMARTMLALRDANPGWKAEHVLAGQILLPRSTYRDPQQIRQFFETFVERLRGAPGVVSVAASSALPAASLGADMELPIQVQTPAGNQDGRAAARAVTPGLFKTLDVPLLQGRDLDASDADPQVRRMVVNRAFVKKFMGDSPAAVGRQVNLMMGAPLAYEVVGVVGDVHHYGVLREAKPEFYVPFATRPFPSMGVAVRTAGDPAAFGPTFSKQLWALDPQLPIAALDTMSNMVRATWSDRRFLAVLIGSFAAVVVVLTLVGVFSVVTFSVSRQVREIGIRMALGAGSDQVVGLVMRQSARTIVVGLALGLTVAWMLSRGLAGLMYGVTANDPWGLGLGAVGVALIAGLGAYLPSRRAAKIDPVAALRAE